MADRAAARMRLDAPSHVDEDFELPAQVNPKRRKCLRCLEPFESQWAGERVCARCKRSSTWRGGEPTPPSARS